MCKSAWRSGSCTTLGEDAMIRLVQLGCRQAPDHDSGDQCVTHNNSGAACTKVEALRTARSVADTQTRGRCSRCRRIAGV